MPLFYTMLLLLPLGMVRVHENKNSFVSFQRAQCKPSWLKAFNLSTKNLRPPAPLPKSPSPPPTSPLPLSHRSSGADKVELCFDFLNRKARQGREDLILPLGLCALRGENRDLSALKPTGEWVRVYEDGKPFVLLYVLRG
jgi:hypothetical protein